MGVRVCIQQGEEGELGDRLDVAWGRDDPAGDPVPIPEAVGKGRPAEGLHGAVQRPPQARDQPGALDHPAGRCQALVTLVEHAHGAQVAQHRHTQGGRQAGPELELLAPAAAGMRRYEIPTEREGAQCDQGKQGGQDQVVRHCRNDAQPLDQHPDQHEAVIVIVQVPAGIPGIIGREGGALEHRVEVGEVHRLLAALPRVPEVRVAQADEQEEQEEGQEQSPRPSGSSGRYPPVLPQLMPLAISQGCAEQQDQEQRQADRQPGEGHAEGACQPYQVRQQQQSRRARQWIAAVCQPRQRQPHDRVDQQAQQKQADIPERHPHQRVAVGQRLRVEQLRPGTARLLLCPALFRQDQGGRARAGALGVMWMTCERSTAPRIDCTFCGS